MDKDFMEQINYKSQNTDSENKNNIYQIVSIIYGILIFISGFIVANNKICTEGYLNEYCESSFNITILISVWLVGFIVAIFMYGFGELINNSNVCKKYLKEIVDNERK